MFCIQCGSNIKDSANFCKYCGAKVKKGQSKTDSTSNSSVKSVPEPKEPVFTVEPPRFITKEESMFNQTVMTDENPLNSLSSSEQTSGITDFDPILQQTEEKFDPINDETIDLLYSRERDVDIKEELKEILSDVEKIEQRLNIGLVSKEEATDQIQEKQNLISALKSERKSLKMDKIRIEILETEIKELNNKLDKLHIMYNEGKISHESVYNKLKGEYTTSLEDKKIEYEQLKKNVDHWLKVLELDVQKMKEDIDLTNTKADLGEIDKEVAESKQSELEIDIYRKELAYHALKKVQETLTL